jgi:hypothetical protein
MAKARSPIVHLSGTVGNIVIVNSAKYGEHPRAKRGTHKPALLNNTMQQSSEQLINCNKPAKVIFDAVRFEHKDGDLWTDILTIFRAEAKTGKPFNPKSLMWLECSKKYSLHKLLSRDYDIDVKLVKKKLQVTVSLKTAPKFNKRQTYVEGYQVGITMVFPDLAEYEYKKVSAQGPVTKFKSALQPLEFMVPVPKENAPWLLFLSVTGCVAGDVITMPQVKGMAVAKISETGW